MDKYNYSVDVGGRSIIKAFASGGHGGSLLKTSKEGRPKEEIIWHMILLTYVTNSSNLCLTR